MYGHLQGFLDFLDLLAEDGHRHADLIAGGGFRPELRLQPVAALVRDKIPLTQDQISRLFETRSRSKVSLEH